MSPKPPRALSQSNQYVALSVGALHRGAAVDEVGRVQLTERAKNTRWRRGPVRYRPTIVVTDKHGARKATTLPDSVRNGERCGPSREAAQSRKVDSADD